YFTVIFSSQSPDFTQRAYAVIQDDDNRSNDISKGDRPDNLGPVTVSPDSLPGANGEIKILLSSLDGPLPVLTVLDPCKVRTTATADFAPCKNATGQWQTLAGEGDELLNVTWDSAPAGTFYLSLHNPAEVPVTYDLKVFWRGQSRHLVGTLSGRVAIEVFQFTISDGQASSS